MLKKQIANDSNSLNNQFYKELLHIVGIEEIKEGSKKVIQRCKIPNDGSLLENTLNKLRKELSDVYCFSSRKGKNGMDAKNYS